MHSPSPDFSGGSGRRNAILVGLTAVVFGAVAWLAWRASDARTTEVSPTSTAAAATHEPAAGITVTPALATADAATLAELEAPAVISILATATAVAAAVEGGGAGWGGDDRSSAAAMPAAASDPLAPIRELEADGYTDAARQVYRELAAAPGDLGLPAGIALARLALAEEDHAGAAAALEAAAARASGKPIAQAVTQPTLAAPGDQTPSEPPSAIPAAVPTSLLPLAETLDVLATDPAGLYLYGLALEGTGRQRDAVDAFARYGAALPAMADIAAMAVGNNLFALGDSVAALDAFTRARDGAPDPGTASLAALRRGNALLRLGPPDAAIAAYQDAFERADGDNAQAQALAGIIAAEVAAGRDEEARQVRLRLVRELPGTALALAAMEKLRAAGGEVTAAEEAAVRAGNGDHEAALQGMTTAIAADPAHPSQWSLDILRWRSASGEHAALVEAADAFLAERPDDPLAPEVAWERARALGRLGQDRDAAAAYGELADRWPASERAADALWQRAWLVLAFDGPAPAAAAFQALATRYPESENARDARFRAGLSAWRSGSLPRAAELWTAVAEGSDGFDRARAEYWLGRAAADSGAVDIAGSHWRAAAAADPTGYYGLRAAERLGLPEQARAPGADSTPAEGGADLTDAEFDRAVTPWLAAWDPAVNASSLPQARADLLARAEVQRGAAWLALGDRHAALRALRAVNKGAWGKPLTQIVLARHAAGLGLFEIATSAAGGAIGAAPPEQRLAAPATLARLAYPEAFGALVRAEAEANRIPLALLYALIRQESRFEPTARSGAGATGLTQVMPATGEGLAGALGESDFAVDKLYRPHYALRFGAFLFGRHLEAYHDQAMPALAAYNAGGGNAARWWEAAAGDSDLFAELVDFRETRLYVRLVAEHAVHYRRLYPGMR